MPPFMAGVRILQALLKRHGSEMFVSRRTTRKACARLLSSRPSLEEASRLDSRISKRDRSHSTSSSAAAAEFEGISEQGLEASRPYSRISSREQAAVAGGGQQARLEKLAPSTCLSAPTGFRGY